MIPDTTPDDIIGVSILLRSNSVEFHIRKSELPMLEETLTAITLIPASEPKKVQIQTNMGLVNFFSSHLTGWIIYDDPSQIYGWGSDGG
jgi:hypothetical protein